MQRSRITAVVSIILASLLCLIMTRTANAAGSTPAACSQLGTATLHAGSHGPAVTALQTCLTQLGYPTSGVDGQDGGNTTQAVFAAQGNLNLTKDGAVGPLTRTALASASPVGLPAGCRSTDGLCVSLSRGVVFVHQPGHAVFALHTSTGNNQYYINSQGQQSHAVTPTGRFTICRKIPGLHLSSSVDNGAMYWPMYFNYGAGCTGVALHGELGTSSVPAAPASHGCARIAMAYLQDIYSWVQLGTPGSVIA